MKQPTQPQTDLKYQTGFGNEFSTEALPGALPIGQNSPQKPPYGLYPEQVTGSAFTAPRGHNLRSWLYRIRPSSIHGDFKSYSQPQFQSPDSFEVVTPPTQMRWSALDYPKDKKDWLDSIITYAGNGGPNALLGTAVHLYAATDSMRDRVFANADAEMLFVPQEGELLITTELGLLDLKPGEIAVIPRGIKMKIDLKSARARGYFCENFGSRFEIPGLGPIGANGLANPRDFQIPIAHYQDENRKTEFVTKFQGKLWQTEIPYCPFDVVAWHGNYAPYKYDLRRFNTMNTVSYDHPDPSIFTVLTSPSGIPGTANIDFVIFPSRWMVAENTFRPPYYHRNLMSEFMGLVTGFYDAKPDGFEPGGASLHNCMTGHGPDADTFKQGTEAELKPHKYDDTIAFMLETRLTYHVSSFALNGPTRQKNYIDCWKGLKSNFKP